MTFTVNEAAAYGLGYNHTDKRTSMDEIIPGATEGEKMAFKWGMSVASGQTSPPPYDGPNFGPRGWIST